MKNSSDTIGNRSRDLLSRVGSRRKSIETVSAEVFGNTVNCRNL
jgi:hypothetical protein